MLICRFNDRNNVINILCMCRMYLYWKICKKNIGSVVSFFLDDDIIE